MSGADHQDREYIAQHLADRETVCPECGYQLKGNPGDSCPECGLQLKILLVGSRKRKGRDELLLLDGPQSGAHWFEQFGLISVASGFGFQVGAFLVMYLNNWFYASLVFEDVVLIMLPCIASVLLLGWLWKRVWIVHTVKRAFCCTGVAWAATIGCFLIFNSIVN